MHLIICVPGQQFTGQFLDSWTELLSYLHFKGITYTISRQYSPNLYECRSLCLRGDFSRGKSQKPLNGLNYDYILWIDSDMVFSPKNFAELLADLEGSSFEVISAAYKTADQIHFAAVRDVGWDYFKNWGHFKFLTEKDLFCRLMEVEYCGMGFMLMKKGVMEKLEYPWFEPMKIKFEGFEMATTEDVSLCGKLQKAGVKIILNTFVRVGHQKNLVIY